MPRDLRDPRGHTSPIRGRDGRAPTEREMLRLAVSKPKRGKSKPRVNAAAVIMVAVLLVAAAICVGVILKRERPQETRQSELAGALMGTADGQSFDKPTDAEAYEYITRKAEDIHRGDLILVNYQHKYVFPENEKHLLNVYENKTSYYKVAYNHYLLDGRVLEHFNDLTSALYEKTGETNILVNSTYRDLESQKKIYEQYAASNGEEYASKYVATPGYSEHHTGLSVDIGLYYDDGTGTPLEDYADLEVLNGLLVEYGFVQRYRDNKYSYTHINTEPWHYRYVGVPHSSVMEKYDLCLEEYIEYVKDYTADGSIMLVGDGGSMTSAPVSELPESGYAVYYVPASDAGETQIPIPAGKTEYGVSGNNVDGFIVHAYLGSES